MVIVLSCLKYGPPTRLIPVAISRHNQTDPLPKAGYYEKGMKADSPQCQAVELGSGCAKERGRLKDNDYFVGFRELIGGTMTLGNA